jgi:Protein kinase domain
VNDCPTNAEFERLLSGPADEAALAQLERHVGSCASCHARLATLSNVDTLVPDQPSQWRDGPADSAALQTVIERLRSETPATSDAAGRGMHLSFLRPAERAGFLGRLGKYEVRRILGYGGSGMVLEALDPLLKRTVAIKILSPWTVLDDETRERFLREAQSAAALAHENVVAIHAVEQIDGTPFLVLEFVAGETLHQRVQREGKLPLADVIRIGVQVARGLAAAHRQGLVHRDIKPANILLIEETHRAKIADFGLAKATGDDGLTMTGTLLGTPEFMSPEQALRQEPDERSDLFSLGAVLYFAATGVSPFRGESLFETLDNVRRCQPRPLQQMDPTLPAWFCELVHRILAREPQDRLGWAAAVAEVLESSGSTQTVVLAPPGHETIRIAPPAVAAPQSKRKQWLLAPAGLVAIVLIGASVVWLVAGRRQMPPPKPQPLAQAQQPVRAPQPVLNAGITIAGRTDVFDSLAAALAAAQDSDVVEIHVSGPLLTPPIAIAGKRLTIRAAAGAHPVLLENPGGRSNQPLLQSDTDLRLEGLEIHWSIEVVTGLSEAELLSRSIIVTTHGQLLVAHCRIVSERMNGCLAGTCRTVLIRNSHLVSKGMGVFWRPEAGGRLEIDNSVLENRFGITVLIDGVGLGAAPGQIRLARSTLVAESAIQLFLESATRQPLPLAADQTLFDCQNLTFLLMTRPPRGKAAAKLAAKVEEIPGVLRNWIAWSEEGNVYRRGLKFVSRAAPMSPGLVRSADIADAQQWLDFWKLPASQSIDGEIRFQPRSRASTTDPLVLDAIDNPSGPVPAGCGAAIEQLGPGPAYHAWRSSPDYSVWPASADR